MGSFLSTRKDEVSDEIIDLYHSFSEDGGDHAHDGSEESPIDLTADSFEAYLEKVDGALDSFPDFVDQLLLLSDDASIECRPDNVSSNAAVSLHGNMRGGEASIENEIAEVMVLFGSQNHTRLRGEVQVEDVDNCVECGRVFRTSGLRWKVHYNNCASCGGSLCPTCYARDPLHNGKFCGCCGEWHCEWCYHAHEVSTGYLDD